MVVIFGVLRISATGADPSFTPLNSPPAKLPLFLATLVYSFEGCGALLPIENALLGPQQFQKICLGGFATYFVCYAVVGLTGYAAFPFGG